MGELPIPRPLTTTIGAILLAIPVLSVPLTNPVPFLWFVSVSMLFMLYRVYTRDKVARFISAALSISLVAFGVYVLFGLPIEQRAGVAISSLPPSTISEMNSSSLRQGLFLLCFGIPVILLYLPRSNRWFKCMPRNEA